MPSQGSAGVCVWHTAWLWLCGTAEGTWVTLGLDESSVHPGSGRWDVGVWVCKVRCRYLGKQHPLQGPCQLLARDMNVSTKISREGGSIGIRSRPDRENHCAWVCTFKAGPAGGPGKGLRGGCGRAA